MNNTVTYPAGARPSTFDIEQIRSDFPILERRVEGKPLIYLDSAATSLKPKPVVQAIVRFYTECCANIHRGVHLLSSEASDLYEGARRTVSRFLNADEEEIVFLRNATEGINLVSHSLSREGAVAVTLADHHSAILPWFEKRKILYVGVEPNGMLRMSDLEKIIRSKPALVCLPHVSNALGAITPIKEAIDLAHRQGVLVLVDGSQSVPHMPVDVKALDCDFLVFSGHKMLGPSGIGVLFGKRELLEQMQPFLLGGAMNKEVHKNSYRAELLPGKFEAGTPNIEGAIGLGAAVEYIESIGIENIERHTRTLTGAAIERLVRIDRISVHGPLDPMWRGASVAFELRGLDAHGLAKILSNRYAIMVRSGYHCAQPLHEELGLKPTVRASFYLYNTVEEVRSLAAALEQIAREYTRS